MDRCKRRNTNASLRAVRFSNQMEIEKEGRKHDGNSREEHEGGRISMTASLRAFGRE